MGDLISEKLHDLINKEEYENKKLLRLIDYEKEQQSSLQVQIDKMTHQVEDTEKQSVLLTREIQDVERQVTASQSIIITLSRASKMSRQHVTETHKKLARLEEEGRKRAEQYEQALQRYRETWSRHQKVYCSFPGVPQIMLLEDEVETLRKKAQDLGNKQTAAQRESEEEMDDVVEQEVAPIDTPAMTEDNTGDRNEKVNSMETSSIHQSAAVTIDRYIETMEVEEGTEQEVVGTSVESKSVSDLLSSPAGVFLSPAADAASIRSAESNSQALEVAIQEAPHVQFTPQIIGTDLSGIKQAARVPSSTPHLGSLPSVSPFQTISPVLPVPGPVTPTFPPTPLGNVSGIPATTSPHNDIHSSPHPFLSSSSNPVIKRCTVPSKLPTKLKVTPPASPKIAPKLPTNLKVTPPASPKTAPKSIPKLLRPAPRLVSPVTPKKQPALTQPKLATPLLKPRPRQATHSLTPKISSVNANSPKPVNIGPKASSAPGTSKITIPSSPKVQILNTPRAKILATPKIQTLQVQTVNKSNALKKPMLVSTPKKPAKHVAPKNTPDLAASTESSMFATPVTRVKQPSRDASVDAVAGASRVQNLDGSVYSTPSCDIEKEGNKGARDEQPSFSFNQFATPVASPSMFGEQQSTNDQFEFGFSESEASVNSAFGMFGNDNESANFGGDSGFGGESSGFSFNFGEGEESSSMENNCNALFG